METINYNDYYDCSIDVAQVVHTLTQCGIFDDLPSLVERAKTKLLEAYKPGGSDEYAFHPILTDHRMVKIDYQGKGQSFEMRVIQSPKYIQTWEFALPMEAVEGGEVHCVMAVHANSAELTYLDFE